MLNHPAERVLQDIACGCLIAARQHERQPEQPIEVTAVEFAKRLLVSRREAAGQHRDVLKARRGQRWLGHRRACLRQGRAHDVEGLSHSELLRVTGRRFWRRLPFSGLDRAVFTATATRVLQANVAGHVHGHLDGVGLANDDQDAGAFVVFE